MLKRISLLAATMALCAPAAMAGFDPTPVYSKSETTKAFVGFNFVFGASGMTPEAIIGVTHGTTDASNDVTGIKGSLHFGLGGDFGLRSGKLTGLAGSPNTQGELGLGYSFGRQSMFGVVGINGKHLQAGADIDFGGGVEGYFGAHTFDGFDKRNQNTLAPPPD